MPRILPLLPLLLVLACPSCKESKAAPNDDAPAATALIQVFPFWTRSIGGESELVRQRYFGICDHGVAFDQRVRSAERYRYLTEDLNISFGRNLGPVQGVTRRNKLVREDPARPGFVDVDHVREQLTKHRHPQSKQFREDFGPNLDVAAHGQSNPFPDFMGRFTNERVEAELAKGPNSHTKLLPQNIQAAAELSALVFKYGFDDFTRPRYYEPINEPHWFYLTDPRHIADWHLATMEKMHAENPGVLVGGPCSPVGYFYSQDYRSFNGLKNFIDATDGQLDFYSFHVYDYFQWNGDGFDGLVLSGLPLEGVLDLVPNYTSVKFGKETPIIVSETGGYSSTFVSDPQVIEDLATRHGLDTSGFEGAMRVRSVHDFIQTSSTIANVLTFMDHPHTVKKAVPFILLEASRWDPKYYATLYAPKDFDKDADEWVPSTLHDFYRLFADLEGRRVMANCSDPDIQTRVFMDGKVVHIVANNLAEKPEVLKIATEPFVQSVSVRRYRRKDDHTPELIEESNANLDSIPIGPRETLVINITHENEIREDAVMEETAHYGREVLQKADDKATFTIATPRAADVEKATLRIGYNRPAGTTPELVVTLNGNRNLSIPVEDAAPRYTHEKHGYSTTKIIPLEASLLKDTNTVTISFPDGQPGTIGSAVIRTCRKQP